MKHLLFWFYRADRLLRLYRVLGLYDEEIFDNGQIIDPDDTYELTTDNVKKILAIYMRFRLIRILLKQILTKGCKLKLFQKGLCVAEDFFQIGSVHSCFIHSSRSSYIMQRFLTFSCCLIILEPCAHRV